MPLLSPKHHISPKYPVKQEVWQRANELKIVVDTGYELDFYKDFITIKQLANIFNLILKKKIIGTYNVSGQVVFTNPPLTGYLVVKNCSGDSVFF